MSWNTSYVYANDNLSGWGDRYFFTYFNEIYGRHPCYVVAEVSALCVVFLASIISNTTIVACIFRYPEIRTVTNNFIVNLAVADSIFAFSIPFVAYSRLGSSWVFGDVACKVIPYTQFVSGVVLLWTLTWISLDRYSCIVVSPYRSYVTMKYSSILSGMTWLFAVVFFSPTLLYFREKKTDEGSLICTLVFPKPEGFDYVVVITIVVVVGNCVIPIAVTVYNYVRIFWKIVSTRDTWASPCVAASGNVEANSDHNARRQSEVSLSEIFTLWSRKTSNDQLTTSNGRQGSLSQHEEARFNKHVKVIRMLSANVLIVLIMWSPFMVVMLLLFMDGYCEVEDTKIRSHTFVGTLIVAYVNTAANPLVYGVLSENFRACLKRMCCGENVSEANDVVGENTVQQGSLRRHDSCRPTRNQSFRNSSGSHRAIV